MDTSFLKGTLAKQYSFESSFSPKLVAIMDFKVFLKGHKLFVGNLR